MKTQHRYPAGIHVYSLYWAMGDAQCLTSHSHYRISLKLLCAVQWNTSVRSRPRKVIHILHLGRRNVFVTGDSCVIVVRRNDKTSKCSGPDLHRARFTPTFDPRRYVSCSLLSYCRFGCRILIPPDTSVYMKLGGKRNLRLGRSSGAVLIQILASRTCQL
jgi:hypothetical protein